MKKKKENIRSKKRKKKKKKRKKKRKKIRKKWGKKGNRSPIIVFFFVKEDLHHPRGHSAYRDDGVDEDAKVSPFGFGQRQQRGRVVRQRRRHAFVHRVVPAARAHSAFNQRQLNVRALKGIFIIHRKLGSVPNLNR
jgi:hypothetical protein